MAPSLNLHSAARQLPSSRSIARAERSWGPVQLVSIVAAAVLATQVKTWAESVLQPAAERLIPPTSAEKDLPGADPTGNPDEMPPTLLADRVQSEVGRETLPDDVVEKIPPVLHWAMGVGLGSAYGVLAHRFPAVRLGHGLAFGATAFALTHATTLPALNLQESPTRLPASWWGWELGSHLVYGCAVDTVVRLGDALAAKLSHG